MFANSLIIKGSAFCCFNIFAIALKCFLVIFNLYTYRVRALYKVYSNTSNASQNAYIHVDTPTVTTQTIVKLILQPPEQIVNFSNSDICKVDVARWRCLQTQHSKVLVLVESWRRPNLLLSFVGLSSCGLDFFLYFSLSQPLDIHGRAYI